EPTKAQKGSRFLQGEPFLFKQDSMNKKANLEDCMIPMNLKLRRILPYGLAFILPLITLTFQVTGPHRSLDALLWLLAIPSLALLDHIGGPARREPIFAEPRAGSPSTGLLYGLALLQSTNILLAVSRTFQSGLTIPAAVAAVILLGASSAHTLLVA